MSKSLAFPVVLFLCGLAVAAEGDPRAMSLADEVVKASGGQNWPKVSRIQFTFNVEQGGQVAVSAKHDWDVRSGSDTVSWAGKTVTVKLGDVNREGDAKAAFQRWTNDSYWLLAPLKLKDHGARLSYKGEQEADGTRYEVLHLSFENVGMTPGDQYNLYIDPQSHLLRRWDYMPTPDKKVMGTWENYKPFDGLLLATEHHFGDKRIYFTDVQVQTDAK